MYITNCWELPTVFPKRDSIEIDLRTKEGVKKVSEYLIEGYYDILPKNRFLDRIVSNPNKKFVYQFDLDTFLSTDENYFFQNTNNI